MEKLKKAFTLTELLIALAVLGLLIAVLAPIISNLIPDQNALMAKRSYYAIQTIVSEMINDEACYPNLTQLYDATEVRVGFDDGFGYADCILWGGTQNAASIDTADAATKFITLFRSKLDIKPEVAQEENAGNNNPDGNPDDNPGDNPAVNPDAEPEAEPDNPQAAIQAVSPIFETRDGIRWAIEPGFANNNKDSFALITVDVNGAENPNCAQANGANANLATGANCQNRVRDFDIYTVRVYADGRIEIMDDWAAEAIDINKDVTGSEAND